MANLLNEADCLRSTDVIGGVGGVDATNVLADLFEMQGLLRLTNEVGYLTPDLAASDGDVSNDD